MGVLDKIRKTDQEVNATGYLVQECDFSLQYPGIFEMITRRTYEGKHRDVGRMIMYAEPNRATLVMCDVASGLVTFYAKETFSEALEGLEKALQDGTCDWRKDKRSRSRT
jgi:hypothetical protein